MEGWIKIHRRLLDWEWYGDTNMLRLWIHLLLKASLCERKSMGMVIGRGQVVTSLSTLSEETGLSVRSLRTCIEKLQNDKQIDIQTTNRNTTITICNFDTYQVSDGCERQTNDKPSDKPTTSQAKKGLPSNSPLKKEVKEERKETNLSVSKENVASDDATQNRKQKFYDSLVPYVGIYGKAMIRNFFDYWSEENRSHTKMRFELEKTWNLSMRLRYWASRDKNFEKNGNRNNQTADEQRQHDRMAKLASILTN